MATMPTITTEREEKSMDNRISVNLLKRIVSVIFILSLIPIFAITVYMRPFADDYAYAVNTHDAWVTTHSVLSVLVAAFKQIGETWKTWQGSFSAVFFFSLQPGLFSEKVYGLSAVILILVFILGNRFFFRTVFHEDKAAAAMRSILIGEAGRYADERDNWNDILEASEDEVILPTIQDHPQPIYYIDFDITEDAFDYRNESMALYHHIASVVAQ